MARFHLRRQSFYTFVDISTSFHFIKLFSTWQISGVNLRRAKQTLSISVVFPWFCSGMDSGSPAGVRVTTLLMAHLNVSLSCACTSPGPSRGRGVGRQYAAGAPRTSDRDTTTPPTKHTNASNTPSRRHSQNIDREIPSMGKLSPGAGVAWGGEAAQIGRGRQKPGPGLRTGAQMTEGEVAAAAESLPSCPTLCDPIDRSPPGSAVPGILQARTLEWAAISFPSAWKWKVKVKSLSHVWLFTTPWAAAHQAPPSMEFSRQEYWSGVPLSSLDQRG